MLHIAGISLTRWQTGAMQMFQNFVLKRCLPVAVAFLFGVVAQPSLGQVNESDGAALLEKHAALTGQLTQNPFRRPLFLESTQSDHTVSGNAYAVLDSPFSTVSTTFKNPERWCDVLILHINTKYCRASAHTNPSTLTVKVGKKIAQPLEMAFSLEFVFRVTAASPNYLAVQLSADEGPMSTSNYSIELQAVPLPEGGKTFIHLRYAYDYGVIGRLAMQAYLATLGSSKVGFTQLTEGGATANYVGGMRGAIERNTMRYYLAIEAYLASLNQAPAQQFTTRLQYWFDATETYPRQLHEVDRNPYLVMKKDEYQRQQTTPPD